jgi:transposase
MKLDHGYSHIDLSRALRLVEPALRRWVSQLQQERGGITLTSKVLKPEQLKSKNLKSN